jgi:hypothetical protein
MCTEHCTVLLDGDGAVSEQPQKKDMGRRLDFSLWMLAWDRYALGNHCCLCVGCIVHHLRNIWDSGAAICNQMSFSAAMKHKTVVSEIACGATSEGRTPILGVLFDEVSR